LNTPGSISRFVRSAALVSASVIVTLCAVEVGFRLYDATHRERKGFTTKYSGANHYAKDHDLGYMARPGAKVSVRRARYDRTIYDVVYTISDQGVRVTEGDPDGETWLFMGCSRTFGEGVNDAETLPSQFSAALGKSANVINLGMHGYGPHQMLRRLETNRLAGVDSPVKHVVYPALWEHVRRAAGRAVWDLHGPHYELAGDSIVYTGPHHNERFAKWVRLLEKSDFARFFLHRLYLNFDASDEDIERYARILERSAKLARDNLGAEFTVVFWDDDSDVAQRVLARLEPAGLDVVRVSSIIPRAEWEGLGIPLDGHPTPAAYEQLAGGLLRHFRIGHSTPIARTNADN
jgi:hypothetical protein